jgi:putative ATPase
MSDLWTDQRTARREAVTPLAARMRPRTLDEFAGQSHILGEGCLLRRMLDADRLASVLFWGPPGTGKTTLAEIIARHSGRHFVPANASLIGVKDVRTVIADATRRVEEAGERTIFFLDEIHRFARNQQDVLLHDVERGMITLIGATTENPYFMVNSALLSRSTLFQFEALSEAEVAQVVRHALVDARGFGGRDITIDNEAMDVWTRLSDGDARRALNALEVAVGSAGADPVRIDRTAAEQSMQAKVAVYDGSGDEHYDVISAFIKSMRGGDPDAAVYWLARMLHAGEDPRFIARRIAVLASEDIGQADPNALTVAASAWTITERVGMPECQLTLAEAAIYMSMAPKSQATARAIWAAMTEVREGRTIAVPKVLRDGHYAGAALLGHGEGYVSPHDVESADGLEVSRDYLGVDRVFYRPTSHGAEAEHRRRLESAGEA